MDNMVDFLFFNGHSTASYIVIILRQFIFFKFSPLLFFVSGVLHFLTRVLDGF